MHNDTLYDKTYLLIYQEEVAIMQNERNGDGAGSAGNAENVQRRRIPRSHESDDMAALLDENSEEAHRMRERAAEHQESIRTGEFAAGREAMRLAAIEERARNTQQHGGLQRSRRTREFDGVEAGRQHTAESANRGEANVRRAADYAQQRTIIDAGERGRNTQKHCIIL